MIYLRIASAVPNVYGKCLYIIWLWTEACGVKLYLQMGMIYASLNLTEWAVASNYLPKPLPVLGSQSASQLKY